MNINDIDQFLQNRDLPGVIGLAVNQTDVLYEGAFGVADTASDLPLQIDTPHAIMSMTKPVTSLATMMLVEAGELVILASAENGPVALAPEQPTLKDLGVDLNLGYQYIITAPAGMSDEIRDEIAGVVAEILADPESETRQFIEKQYPPAPIVTQGAELREQILTTYDANVAMMKALAE